MIDTAAASSSPNLDLKVHGKTGNKAEKGGESHKKAAFQDALKAQVHARSDKGKLPEKADPLAGLAEEAADAAEDATDLQPTLKPQKDHRHLTVSTKAEAAPSADVTETRPATDPHKLHNTENRKQTVQKDGLAEKQRGPDESQPQPTQTKATDGELTTQHPVRVSKAKASEPEHAEKADDIRDTAPARDVLNMLADKGHSTANLTNILPPQSQVMQQQQQTDMPEGEDSVQRYRISRADGRGGAIEIETHGHGVDKDRDVQATKPSVQDVTVLDQRRFLAPSEQGNLQSVISAISGDADWQVAMQPGSELANAAAQAGNGKVVNTLKIQMHPIDLGLVTATMRLQGEELTVELKVETGAAYKQLRDDQSQIIESLKSQGFNVDQVSVVFAPDRSDQASGQQPQANGQGASFAQQQQQARDGGNGNATARAARMTGQERAGGNGNEGGEIRVDGTSVGRTGAQRGQPVWL